jgi:tyrosinase
MLGPVSKYQAECPATMAGNAVITAITASLCLFSGASAWPFSKRQTLSIADIQKQALANAYKVLDGTLADGLTRGTGCNKDTVGVRKE